MGRSPAGAAVGWARDGALQARSARMGTAHHGAAWPGGLTLVVRCGCSTWNGVDGCARRGRSGCRARATRPSVAPRPGRRSVAPRPGCPSVAPHPRYTPVTRGSSPGARQADPRQHVFHVELDRRELAARPAVAPRTGGARVAPPGRGRRRRGPAPAAAPPGTGAPEAGDACGHVTSPRTGWLRGRGATPRRSTHTMHT